MKATCNREGMLTAFQVANSVVPANTPKPILKNCLLDVTDEAAILRATDLEIGVQYRVSGVTCERPGKAVLPTSAIIAILRELHDDTLHLEATDSGVRIRGSGAKFDLPSEDPLGFPELPSFASATTVGIPAGRLALMMRRTVFAAAKENTRFALCSVQFEVEPDGAVRMVATDGHRLALMPGMGTVGTDLGATKSVLLPPKAVNLISRTLQDPEETVEITLTDNEALFRTGKVSIYTRLVDGRFPRFTDVIPTNTKTTVALPVDKFHGAVRQAKIVTSSESKGVKFSFGDGELLLRSHGADVGESEVRMPVSFDGKAFELTFNPDLLVDMLKVLDPTEEITLHVGDVRRATVLKAADEYTYVAMPMNRDTAPKAAE